MSDVQPGPGSLATEPEQRALPFEFYGSGGEYFRIWIVNLLLTLATLGIYSAWAKVRTERYFARSARLAGSSFDYVADPLSILRGRLLVLGFFALYSLTSTVAPLLQPVMGLVLIAVVPWALIRSMAFRAHNTTWRGLRFRFDARYGEAFAAYVGLPFASVLTLGLLYPYALYRQRRFLVCNARFGTTPFEIGSRAGDFYRLFLVLLLLPVLAALIAPLAMQLGPEIAPLAIGAVMLPVYFFVFGHFAAGTMNLTYDGTRFGEHRISANVPAWGLAWIYFTNALAMLLSLGLLIPFAQVRLARFRFEHLMLHTASDLDAFVAAQSEEVASLGAELGDALDLDLGL